MPPVRFAVRKSKVLAFGLETFDSYPPSTTRTSLEMDITPSAERRFSSYQILASDCGHIVPGLKVKDNSHIASLRAGKLPWPSCPIFALGRIRIAGRSRAEQYPPSAYRNCQAASPANPIQTLFCLLQRLSEQSAGRDRDLLLSRTTNLLP